MSSPSFIELKTWSTSSSNKTSSQSSITSTLSSLSMTKDSVMAVDKSPLRLTSQPFLRIWDPNTNSNSDQQVESDKSERFRFDADDIYEMVDSDHPKGCLMSKKENDLLIRYFILEFAEKEPIAVENQAATARLTGPVTNPADFVDTDKSSRVTKVNVSVLLAPTLMEEYNVPRGFECRGEFDLPSQASRTTNFDSVCCPTLTPEKWEELLITIGDIVDQFCEPTTSEKGTVIDLFSREIYNPRTDDRFNAVPLVLVAGQTISKQAARSGVFHITHILCMNGFHNTEVEIIVKSFQRAAAVVDYAEQPKMGNSMGPIGNRGGTMGGFVRLFDGGGSPIQEEFILSCHHVATETTEPLAENSSITFNCPTDVLISESIAELQKVEKYQFEDLRQANRMSESYRKDFRDMEVERSEKDLKTTQEALAKLKLATLSIGRVFKSSGLRTTNAPIWTENERRDEELIEGELQSEMDWLLVQASRERIIGFPYNTISPRWQIEPYATNATTVGQSLVALRRGNLKIETIRNCLSNTTERIVFRIDRYNSVHIGKVNPQRARTKLSTAGLAYTIAHYNIPFAAPGDSGCWIFDPSSDPTNPSVVGMVFGVTPDNATYVMDMEEVVQHVKQVTGYEMVLPGRDIVLQSQ